MRTPLRAGRTRNMDLIVGMKPLSERDENTRRTSSVYTQGPHVGMKPLSERDENKIRRPPQSGSLQFVGMKPLSERDENSTTPSSSIQSAIRCRNEATL